MQGSSRNSKTINTEGADELVFLDITASSIQETITLSSQKKTPNRFLFSYCSGEIDNADIRKLLKAGADKISKIIALNYPQLLSDGRTIGASV
jgi:imidazole glycerol phosphate synthase subunit HisF